MHCSSSVWCVLVFLTLLKHTRGERIRQTKKNLHHHMTKREIEYFFGVSDLSEIPEYDVTTPHQTELNGRTMSKFRRRRNAAHSDVLHYKLHAFGSKLRLRLKRNKMLMAPNLVIEKHHGGGVVTTRPAPKNKFYLGKVSSVPGSLVALRNDKGLSGMIRMTDGTFFVQPLPTHLAKRVRRSAITTPHLIFKASRFKQDAFHCQVNKSVNYRFRRSAHRRDPRATGDQKFKILEAALIAPQHYVDKYGENEFATVLLVIGNMVAGMYQDPSIGKIRVFYVVKRIFHIKNISEIGFGIADGGSKKLTKLLSWSAQYMTKDDSDPDHFDVFSYFSDKIVGGRALANHMCAPRKPNGNINSDVGLQSALYVAHETGHNFYLDHDVTAECPIYKYIMSASLPTGVYAATWSNCSSRVIQQFLRGANSKCLDDSPFNDSPLPAFPTVSPADEDKLPGELFDGDKQCEMQYGPGYRLSPYRKGICHKLYCIKGGTELSRLAPMADGSPCGIRRWCIGGVCQDNGKKRINGGWSSWSNDYSSCTRTCGGGVQYRQRFCTNPSMSDGGKPCEGTDKMFRICNSTPCPAGTPNFRHDQCTVRWTGSKAHPYGDPCQLYCRISSTLKPRGTVTDGTRCSFDQSTLDVCVQGKCRKVGCDNKLDSNAMVDRCGKCRGDGSTCLDIKSNYTVAHTIQGPENADVIVELPVGTLNVYFEMRKATLNNLGVQDENGTYLCGGRTSRKSQVVKAADTTIVYTNKKKKYNDRIIIAGPTTIILKVVYICRQQGPNPGTDYSFIRPVQVGETPPVSKYKWKLDAWTSCSVTCGEGVRSRSIRCVRADDLSPARDEACGATTPHKKERCIEPDCPSAWFTTDWTDCSRSCGSGQQTRKVECRRKINAVDYGPGFNCSNDSKPVIVETLRSCNKFACASDWDTVEGLPNIDCGDPIDPNSLYCYRRDQFGQRDSVPRVMCRNMAKPTRLPCTTQPIPTTLPGPETTLSSTNSTKPTVRHSQAGQAHCSKVFTLLVLLFHLT